MFRKKILFLCCLLVAVSTWAQSDSITAKSDSIVSKRSIFVIPHASYQQETSLAPGIAYGYYFKSKDLSRISSISGSVIYTLRNQFIFNTTPKLYFGNNNWYLYSNINLKKYPDFYYGISNQKTDLKQSFTSQNLSILLQPQYAVTKNLFVGPNVSVKVEHVKTDSTFNENKDMIFERFGHAGWDPYYQVSIGGVVTYDTRDNAFYPYKGTFAKLSFSLAQAGWGSTYSLQQISLDVRKYIPLFKTHVLAFQGRFEGIWGQNGIPFQMLPTVGGSDVMRGFRERQYKENLMMALQAEYRIPLFWRLKATVFCATGDVFDSNNFRTDKLKFTYGAGLRCRLNDARVHLRFDIAKNNYGDKLQFYITATEAF